MTLTFYRVYGLIAIYVIATLIMGYFDLTSVDGLHRVLSFGMYVMLIHFFDYLMYRYKQKKEEKKLKESRIIEG